MTDVSVTPVTTTDTSALDALILEIIGSDDGRRDPYSRYERIRSEAPIFRSGLGMWVCTRYEDCQTVLRDPHLGKATETATDARIAARAGSASLGPDEEEWVRSRRSLLFLNPPDHTRLRGLVSKAFTPRTAERLRPEIERLVDELLDAFPTGEPVDVIEALAFPLPVAVIGRMLGVPAKDWPSFRSIMQKTTVLLEPVVPPDELREALDTLQETDAYFLELVGLRRHEPQDDMISHLIAVEEGSDRLTERELIATATLLFGAGFETTTNLIGNGLYALLTHPDQLARLREEPGLIRSAVEELLRYDSPVQLDARHAFDTVTIGGHTLREGEMVMTILGAANRDPGHFTDPARFDVGRDEGPPLSFGSGIHYCLGAALARVEAQVVLERLLARFGDMELATGEPPVRRNRITIRGLTSLPVVFTPATERSG